jgi:DNA-binding NarL/FixJ family response regulator
MQRKGGVMSSIRVLVVEDNVELARKFSDAIAADSGLSLVATAYTGRGGLALLQEQRPDVVLVDLGLPDISGIEIIQSAFDLDDSIDVLVVTMFSDDYHIMSSLEAGATGYLLKDTLPEQICQSIHEIRGGGAPISPSIARRVLKKFHMGTAIKPSPSSEQSVQPQSCQAVVSSSELTLREVEILRLVAKGLSFSEVGTALSISSHTVVTHIKKIYRKLSVHSRGEAVFEAAQLGLV